MAPAWRDVSRMLLVTAALGVATRLYLGFGIDNATTVALSYLTIVLIVAATSPLWVAVAASVGSMLCLNFFFLPPVGTLTIADPENWVVIVAFMAVSLVASNLSSAVRARAQEALDRRDEMARLFDVSRDVLLMTDSSDAMSSLAHCMARRFALDYVAVCLPVGTDWNVSDAGHVGRPIDPRELRSAFAGVTRSLEFDATERVYAGHASLQVGGRALRLVPLRAGSRPIGLLAASGSHVDSGTLDALGGLAAMAIERAQFLEERKTADLARQSEELKSALLASLAHDLRTPLTAIRVAASNLQASWLTPDERHDQSHLVLGEVERLTRLFQNILDMARIDAGAVSATARWVHPSEIVDAARDLVVQSLEGHVFDVHVATDALVKVDPRLTATALSHLLENAAQYSPAESPVHVAVEIADGNLLLKVRDHGAGMADADLSRLFERFYRGSQARRRAAGTGMGLAIARGLLAAEQGRIWAENCPQGGAQFTIAIQTESRPAASVGVEQ